MRDLFAGSPKIQRGESPQRLHPDDAVLVEYEPHLRSPTKHSVICLTNRRRNPDNIRVLQITLAPLGFAPLECLYAPLAAFDPTKRNYVE